MTTRQLEVLVNDQLVGRLREENDLWQFEYATQWIESPQGFALSPALPCAACLHADGASNRPSQWYIDNLLPEETLRTVIAKEANDNARRPGTQLTFSRRQDLRRRETRAHPRGGQDSGAG